MSFNPQRIVLIPRQTTTASGNSNNLPIPGGWKAAILHLNVTAASGTTPTLNVYVQDALTPASATDVFGAAPSGTTVFDDFASFTQVSAAGDWVMRIDQQGTSAGAVIASASLAAGTAKVGPIGLLWRVQWVIAATTPSFTWSLTAQFIP